MKVQRLFAISAFLSTCLCAQTSPEAPVVLKATTRLVQVSVIAQDHQGQPVSDLKKEDFQIKVNGKIEPISIFSADSSQQAASQTISPPPTLPPNVFTNRLQTRAGAPSAVTVILIDTRNTKLTDQIYAKAQVIRYLRTLQPTDHIGIYTFGGTLRVLHDFTTDSTELLNRLSASSKNNALPDISNLDPETSLRNDAQLVDNWTRSAGGASAAEQSFYTVDRILATLRAMEFIANHLAQIPGRKNVIWVSGGFPLEIGFDNIAAWTDPRIEQRTFTDEVSHAMRAMNDANIAIYPVDARGLMVDSRFDASNARIAPRIPTGPPIGVKEQETMQEMASRTGGQAFYNTNDLAAAIHTAVDDSRVTYTLGFYPVGEVFDGRFHKIDVQLTGRSGVKLRYRKGYFDLPEQPEDDRARRAELQDSVWSPIDASALGLTATVQPTPSNPGSIDVTVQIDHKGISLQQQQDRWAGRLDVLFVQRDDQGKQYDGRDDTIQLNLGAENHQKLTTEDLTYHHTLVRSAKAKLLRIVVRDAASGAIGSVTVPLAKI